MYIACHLQVGCSTAGKVACGVEMPNSPGKEGKHPAYCVISSTLTAFYVMAVAVLLVLFVWMSAGRWRENTNSLALLWLKLRVYFVFQMNSLNMNCSEDIKPPPGLTSLGNMSYQCNSPGSLSKHICAICGDRSSGTARRCSCAPVSALKRDALGG